MKYENVNSFYILPLDPVTHEQAAEPHSLTERENDAFDIFLSACIEKSSQLNTDTDTIDMVMMYWDKDQARKRFGDYKTTMIQ